jgi:organic hydroperoxide reductase OsmC/OhrA
MKFPHQYVTNANSNFEGSLIVSTENLKLEITPPSQFGGEDKHWSPEDLFSAGVASCTY